jgi:lipid-binding SYLF domain-containing protein
MDLISLISASDIPKVIQKLALRRWRYYVVKIPDPWGIKNHIIFCSYLPAVENTGSQSFNRFAFSGRFFEPLERTVQHVKLKIMIMKKLIMSRMVVFLMVLSGLFLPRILRAQDESEEKIMSESKEAKEAFLKGDPSLANLFKTSYGYAIFPNVGKGAAGVGGAAGRGTVYEKGKSIGLAHMTQLTVGAQAGGAAYREVIFFENKAALDRFMRNNFEFAAQTSAIAVKSGSSANVNYRDGVVVFSQEKAGLMLEAALGGQKFTYKPIQ